MAKKDNKKRNKKRNKKEFEIPAFTIILMLIFGVIGFLTFYSVYTTVKSCTNEVTGYVDHDGHGGNGSMNRTVEGKYVNVGKDGQHWIAIYVDTDDIFRMESIYAAKYFGNVGDKLIIHYNPDDPDEYYIGDYKKLDGFSVAVFMFIVSGINLVISVVLLIVWNTGKKKTDEEIKKEKKRKLEEKKNKEAVRKSNAEKRIERWSKRYTKNYTNTHICEKIRYFIIDAKLMKWLLSIGGVLIASSFIITCLDIYKNHPIPFNNYPDTFDETVYSIVVEKKPNKIHELDDFGSYYDLKTGNDHILAFHLNEKKINGMDHPIKLHGKLRRVSFHSEKEREIIKNYYQSIGYFETLKDEEYAYYVLDCSRVNLWEEMNNNHILGFLFGVTFIIIALIFCSPSFYLIKFLIPACSGRKYKAKEIDRLANDADTEWLRDIEVLGTPSALIGLNHGLTVVDYSDIHGIIMETKHHETKRRKWDTYYIIIETKKHRKMLLTESERKDGRNSLTKHLDNRFVEYKIYNEKITKS